MALADPALRTVFWDVHSGLPREGPGDRARRRPVRTDSTVCAGSRRCVWPWCPNHGLGHLASSGHDRKALGTSEMKSAAAVRTIDDLSILQLERLGENVRGSQQGGPAPAARACLWTRFQGGCRSAVTPARDPSRRRPGRLARSASGRGHRRGQRGRRTGRGSRSTPGNRGSETRSRARP